MAHGSTRQQGVDVSRGKITRSVGISVACSHRSHWWRGPCSARESANRCVALPRPMSRTRDQSFRRDRLVVEVTHLKLEQVLRSPQYSVTMCVVDARREPLGDAIWTHLTSAVEGDTFKVSDDTAVRTVRLAVPCHATHACRLAETAGPGLLHSAQLPALPGE
jgi:hypothetical protein